MILFKRILVKLTVNDIFRLCTTLFSKNVPHFCQLLFDTFGKRHEKIRTLFDQLSKFYFSLDAQHEIQILN